MSIIAILISVGALVVSIIALRQGRRLKNERRSEERIDNSVKLYMEMHKSVESKGISAFVKSDVWGMSNEELETVAQRIKSNTGEDPLKPIRKAGISAKQFVDHVITKEYRFLGDLESIFKEIKKSH